MKYYYELTKGGLVFGNLITVIAGFLLATQVLWGGPGAVGPVNLAALAAAVIGMAFVMASGCVFNNYIDRDIDALMPRTKGRALVKGHLSLRAALIFGAALGAAGFLILYFFATWIAAASAAVGFALYVFAYTMWGKRHTLHGTIIGALSGAMPPVVGYAAAADRIDMAAAILFFIMLTWQMPHFYAIAIRRREEYGVAKVPVLPVARGIRRTKVSMLVYIGEFTVASVLLVVYGYAGYAYLAVALFLGAVWFLFGLSGLWIADGPHAATAPNERWARQMFFCSLIVLVVLFGTIAITALI